MARLTRLVLPGHPHQIFQRGISSLTVFRVPADFERMLTFLLDAARRFNVAIHAYVLMPDHFHLLATPATQVGLSAMMQALGRSYVRYYNASTGRHGSLWEGRFRATLIDSEYYLFKCMSFIELNPVRAGLASSAGDYPWSSYFHNCGQRVDPLVREHPLFWALGNTPFSREAKYQELVNMGLRSVDQMEIAEATRKGWVLGPNGPSLTGLNLPRRGMPLPRGRPRKILSVPI